MQLSGNLFIKNNLVPPQDLLPKCIIPGDKAIDLFKTRLRCMIFEKTTQIKVTTTGTIIYHNHEQKKEIKEYLKQKNIDLSFKGGFK
jgi:hypothetical protein